jgi:hypothetical protein
MRTNRTVAGERVRDYDGGKGMLEMSNSNSSSGGIGFAGLLTILFIGLKLTGYIGWSWWWVLSPLWISTIVILFIIGVLLLFVNR